MQIPERQTEIHQRIDSAPVQSKATGEDRGRAPYIPRPALKSTPAKQHKWPLPLVSIFALVIVGLAVGTNWIASKRGASQISLEKPAMVATDIKTLFVRAADINAQANNEAKSLLASSSQFTASHPSPDPIATASGLGRKSSPSVATVLATLTQQQKQEIVSGDRVFYKVVLYDNQIQDGDGIEVLLNGKSIGKVDLTNAGKELSVPLKPGEPAQLTCLAIKDGDGGGITFGARSSAGEERSRVMEVGASETWNIQAQ